MTCPLKTKLFLVGMSGFEPLKAKLTDLQSVPFGQLWNIPKNYFFVKEFHILYLTSLIKEVIWS